MADALTSRITLKGPEPSAPEDYLSTSLGVIFPDDVTNQHGDAEHSLIYASPHLPKPISLDLCDPEGEEDRRLFSHYLWNASLLLAELVERDTLGLKGDDGKGEGQWGRFRVKGLDVIEVGAGTALPSIMAGLLGANKVVVTDYPSPTLLSVLNTNINRNLIPSISPTGTIPTSIAAQGHSWGEFKDMAPHKQAYDRVFVCDCLWMPWQHANLRSTINHLLKANLEARVWVIAGFHTGRAKMSAFFEAETLRREAGCEIEAIWERDCEGVERIYDSEWEEENPTVRKRWLVVAVLKRVEGG